MVYRDSRGQFFADAEGEKTTVRFARGCMIVEFQDSTEEEFEEAAEAIHNAIWDEVQSEARETVKGMARAAFAHGDASCDAIAEQFGLSAATVRGMSNGRRNKNSMTLTDTNQAGNLREFVAEDCGW